MFRSSQYTMNIKEITELYDIFDFDYTLTSTTVTKELLQHEFIQDYLMREIAYETYDMWHIKFEHKWEKMVRKYDRLFDLQRNNLIEILKSSGSTTNVENNSDVINEMLAKNFPTPVSGGITTSDIPDNMQQSIGSNNGNSTSDSTTKRTNDSDMAIINKYINEYRDLLEAFTKEFDDLFLGIY